MRDTPIQLVISAVRRHFHASRNPGEIHHDRRGSTTFAISTAAEETAKQHALNTETALVRSAEQPAQCADSRDQPSCQNGSVMYLSALSANTVTMTAGFRMFLASSKQPTRAAPEVT